MTKHHSNRATKYKGNKILKIFLEPCPISAILFQKPSEILRPLKYSNDRILLYYFETKVLMETIFNDDEKIFKSICAGAYKYILKHTEPEQILSAIKENRRD